MEMARGKKGRKPGRKEDLRSNHGEGRGGGAPVVSQRAMRIPKGEVKAYKDLWHGRTFLFPPSAQPSTTTACAAADLLYH